MSICAIADMGGAVRGCARPRIGGGVSAARRLKPDLS
jgi:hypothetical protein